MIRRLFAIIIFFSVFSLVSLHCQGQNQSQGQSNYSYHKALELIENEGDLKQVRRLLNESIRENPKHIMSYVVLTQLDMHEGDYSAALAGIARAQRLNYRKSGASDALLLWWEASIYEELGELGKAVPILERAVGMARKDDKENLFQMQEDLADMYFNLKNYQAADALYNEMLKLDDGAQKPRLGLARNMISRGEYDAALQMLEECGKYNRENPNIYKFQVKAYQAKQEYKKMIDAMVLTYEKSGDADYLDVVRFKKDNVYSEAVLKGKIAQESDNLIWKVTLAEFYDKCHRYAKVVEMLDPLIAEYSGAPELYELRAMSYSELGLTELAVKDMDKCLELQGEDEVYYRTKRGDIYRWNGLYSQAIEDYHVYINSFPTKAYGYYARGWCKELLGDDKGAMEDYNLGLAVDETYPYLYLMRGEMHLKWGNDSLAKRDFEKVLQQDTVAIGGSCRQYALHFLGRNPEALEWMEQMLADDPDDPGIRYDNACLLARMGRCDEAVAALEVGFEKGFRGFPHLLHDDDMDPIRGREDYRGLVERYEKIHREEIAGITTVEEGDEVSVVSEIEMKKMYSGTYEIPCQVNGLPLKMIFDTGASAVTISSIEASFMLKNGYLSEKDVKGKVHYLTASGDIHEGTVLMLKEVRLGDAVLRNIEASVAGNQKAPLLLGQSVLEKFGTITIDNINSKLKIKQ